jgi:tRNA A-37 threonylcarbamoyl transferase component Bud32
VTLPSHIGQYRIIRKIGAGGMGLVYLGEHTLLGRRAAVKTLLPTVASNREIVERFFNEARATSAISDPGVIQVFDFGYHVDGTAYIVLELLEGEALSARLDRLGVLPLGDALRFARQIAGSLAAAHARDIVHRDLKPENIFLVRDAEAQGGERTKIIDFGICKVGAGDPMLTEAGAMIGTPVYMSPEQCRGSAEVDARSDIYAFGCLLFHVLTGRPPFLGEASGDLVVAHIQEPPPPPSRFAPGLPPAVDAVLLRCLAKQPEDRFPSMMAVQAALGAVAVAVETPAPATTPPPPTVPLGRGFRSVYDANLKAALGGSAISSRAPVATVPLALRSRLRFGPPPDTEPPPMIRGMIHDDRDDLDDLEPPPRRRAVRAALACVLVVGVALGLIATPLVLDDDDSHAVARPVQPAAMPVELPPADEPIAASARITAPSPRAVAGAIAASGAEAGDGADPDDAPARSGKPARPRAESRASSASRTARSARSSSAAELPAQRPAAEGKGSIAGEGPRDSEARGNPRGVTSPSAAPPAPAAVASVAAAAPSASAAAAPAPSTPVTSPAAPPARPTPPPASPAPPTEDLYDTR